jgi:hypothetical protein
MQVVAGILLTLVILGAMFTLMVTLNVFDRKRKQLIEALKGRYGPSPQNSESPAGQQSDNQNKET